MQLRTSSQTYRRTSCNQRGPGWHRQFQRREGHNAQKQECAGNDLKPSAANASKSGERSLAGDAPPRNENACAVAAAARRGRDKAKRSPER